MVTLLTTFYFLILFVNSSKELARIFILSKEKGAQTEKIKVMWVLLEIGLFCNKPASIANISQLLFFIFNMLYEIHKLAIFTFVNIVFAFARKIIMQKITVKIVNLRGRSYIYRNK